MPGRSTRLLTGTILVPVVDFFLTFDSSTVFRQLVEQANRAQCPVIAIGRTIVDFETCSTVDLPTVGAYRYSIDPTTDILCASLRTVIGNDEVLNNVTTDLQWDLILRFNQGISPIGATATLVAFNDRFDYYIWKHILTPRYGWPDPDNWQWDDLSQRAAYANLPGSLDEVCRVTDTPGKDEEGHKLMMKMCKPARAILRDSNPWRLHTPENLSRLSTYCGQDTTCEAALDPKLPQLPDFEKKVVLADRAMNSRGIRVDLDRVRQIQAAAAEYGQKLQEELSRTTHGDVSSSTQLNALKAWLIRNGLPVREGRGALDRYAIDAFLDGENYDGSPIELSPPVRRCLTIRREMSKSSLAKLDALLGSVSPADQRVRWMFQYYGARMSGRWSGKIIQPQNLPKGILRGAKAYETALAAIAQGAECLEMLYGARDDTEVPKVMDVLSSCLRTTLVASPGNELVVVDYSAIEARVAAWFAGEEWMLDAYRAGEDIYKRMAGWCLNKAPELVTKQERDDSGKLPELSCQYGLGWRSLKKQAKQKGVILTDAWAKHVVDTYREKHAHIKRLWYDLENRAMQAIRLPNVVCAASQVQFKFDGVTLKMRLPSGRCIWFNRATIEDMPVPWDEHELRPKVCYWGEDADTHRFAKQTAWGGDFMALATQGMARDLVAAALVRTERAGMDPILTVHDEIGFDLPIGSLGFSPVEVAQQAMCDLPPWAAGLPIAAEGFISNFYRK